MKLPAIFARFRKGAVAPMDVANNSGLVSTDTSWFGVIREAFAGAWQSNLVVDGPRNVLAFSAVFACVTGIAGDIGKLRIKLMQLVDGIGQEVGKDSPYWPVLRKPNHYQTRIQFVIQWIVSKLIYGNAYALKERDGRGIVTALYILDPQRVKALVTPIGDVYYELHADFLSGLSERNVTVPASEIIHDTMVALWHPLVGVSPIYACGMSATQGNRIQQNSTKFFENMSRPSGMLLAPARINDEDVARIKAMWEQGFSGGNIGRTAVLGSGMKYEAMAIPAIEAQLIEQLRWTAEDVARTFHYPMFKIGGAAPPGSTVEALNQMYFSDCLQTLIESAELCLDEGLGLTAKGYYTEFDLRGLLRMDAMAQANVLGAYVGAGIMAPNEARFHKDLPAVEGGETPYMQEQNWPLRLLSNRELPTREPTQPAPLPPPADSDKAIVASVTKMSDYEIERESAAALVWELAA